MSKRLVVAVFVLGAVAVGVVGLRLVYAQQASYPIPDSQKVILENQFVRVWEVRLPAGTGEPAHRHGRGLTIALSAYDNETTTQFRRGA